MRFSVLVLLCSVVTVGPALAQTPVPATSVPRVVRLDGQLVPANGLPPAAVETVTLAIYAAETEPTPLWSETQDVRVDAQGRYAVFLGASAADGIPTSVLSGEARWLGIRFARPGEVEQARVPITSVPYAIKASDADTLGGLPPSAFLRARTAGGKAATPGAAGSMDTPSRDRAPAVNTGTANFIGKFVDSVDLTSSVIYESSGRIGVGTGAATPLDIVHAKFTDASGVLTGLAVQNMSGGATAYSGMLFYDHTGALRQFQGYNNSTGEYRINNIAPGGSINFMLGSTSKFRVRPDGDVDLSGALRKAGALFLHNFGGANTFLGLNAGNITMTGTSNTASGASALASNTTGHNSTASGVGALQNNTTGFYNTASGVNALLYNTSGSSNTASGIAALLDNSTGSTNTASGALALRYNTTGSSNTACGDSALFSNTTGNNNTAIGAGANVSGGALQNATAIGASAVVNASNKIRLGNANVTVIEGQVPYTFTSDRTQKEHVQPVDAEGVLLKLRQVGVTTWNYIGQDATAFRHYGPMAQDFYAAFGHDGVGTVGSPTTMNSGDTAGILMLAVQALERRTAEQEARIEALERRLAREQR